MIRRLFLLLATTALFAAEPSRPFFGARPGALEKAKAAAPNDESVAKALKKLITDADKALAVVPPSVMQKTKVPPSGDKHDYMSIAPYYWPNPATKDGLPYQRKDGKVNPESREEAANDTLRARLVGTTVETLALGYYFTGDEKYAEHAAKVLRTWFLDSATKMTPHFRFAQAVPGVNDGRGTGILEARGLADAADAAILLVGSKHWSAADQQALLAWGSAYFEWLTTSKNGQDEHAAKNNHGTWYDVQAVKWALLLGRMDKAKELCVAAGPGRIGVQIEPDGKQPLELARTASFSYSCFNLRALSALAGLGEHVGVDLWQHKTKDGRSLVVALDFLVPYLGKNPKLWTMQQIHESNEDDVLPVLRAAALATGDDRYESLLKEYSDHRSKRLQLLAPR
ncbi:MAG: alginate lyase family protein [Verrucomicrobia bacterium]|nr:alginate lyase family protein [Verrucomicrobiota bacterium]